MAYGSNFTSHRSKAFEKDDYLVKKTNYNHRQCCKNNIIEGLKPIVIKSLTTVTCLESEPKLCQGESKILVKEVCYDLQPGRIFKI